MEYWIENEYYNEEDKNITIFQKLFENKIDIPCFCYHENLSIAGNCRMCLVEINTSIKLVASCAMPMSNNIKIYLTNSRVKKARESILEFLLINHPLDCPVCDQAGECDLQDINLVYGSDQGRYYESVKRAVIDKKCGTLIEMIMTRCIHCTKCIRFLNEVIGDMSLGMINRGGNSEISTYILKYLSDEMSGNLIDLCPVGALTSKPYSFVARPWELNFLESIDILDSIGSNIRIDYFNNKIYRILPIYNKNLNEDWITNRARFFYDSNQIQRLSNPLLKINNRFIVIGWVKVFYFFFMNLLNIIKKNGGILSIVGNFSDLNNINDIRCFFNSIGSEICYSDFLDLDNDLRHNFLFNNFLFNLENNYIFIFICFNSRLESPILNSRLRKLYLLNEKIKFFGFGLNSSYLNLPIKLCNNNFNNLIYFIKNKLSLNFDLFFNNYNNSIYNFYFKKNKIFFIFGISFFYKFNKIFNYLKFYINLNFYSEYGIVLPFLGYLNFFEVNSNNKIYLLKENFIFLDNIDNNYFFNQILLKELKNNFIVYYGNFFDLGSYKANLIIPNFSVFEKNSININIEGNFKKSFRVITNNDNIIKSEDFFEVLKILKYVYIKNNFSIFNNFYRIINLFFLYNICLNFYDNLVLLNNIIYLKYDSIELYENFLFSSFVINYYKLDIYSCNSKILNLASIEYLIKLNIFFK